MPDHSERPLRPLRLRLHAALLLLLMAGVVLQLTGAPWPGIALTALSTVTGLAVHFADRRRTVESEGE